jgi:Na+/melibiose symporter-like transporter
MAFYLSFTLFSIPYLAWANEFTCNSQEKTFTFCMLSLASSGGSALFYLLPLLPFFLSSDINPKILEATLWLGTAVLLPSLIAALVFVPNSFEAAPLAQQGDKPPLLKQGSNRLPLTAVWLDIIQNKPLILYVLASMCLGMGLGMWMGMFFIYVDTYLNHGLVFAEFLLWGVACGALSVPFWYRLSLALGKRLAWLVAMVMMVGAFQYSGTLRPDNVHYIDILAVSVVIYFSLSSATVVGLPMLCDVIDYGRLQSGNERNALYFSIYALMAKIQMALGGALGMSVAAWYGFDVTAAEPSATSVYGLQLSVAWIPALFAVLAALCVALMPLDERRVGVIRRRLGS